MFLLNSRHPFFYEVIQHSLFRSYRVNLPSSFNTINPYAFIYTTYLHVFVLVQFINYYFSRLHYPIELQIKQCYQFNLN